MIRNPTGVGVATVIRGGAETFPPLTASILTTAPTGGRRRDRRQLATMATLDEEFSAFVAARADHLFRQAWLLTGSRPAAEDLVQTALTKAYAAWSRVRRADDPVAYVHGVLMKSFLSDRRRRSSAELPVAEPRIETVAQPDPADVQVDRIALAGALATLSRTDRAVVVLRYWHDRSVDETAAALGLSEAAVKNRSLRALRRLSEELSELSDRHVLDDRGSRR
jgi:RNA polymerase sigma-70 factor (sigma-E family)